MEEITITEAFAELKLITKKIAKKRETILQNLTRMEHVKDQFGDTPKMVEAELQSIQDHETRFVRIKAAMSKANLENEITVEGETKSIYAWILWKRDIADNSLGFVNTAIRTVDAAVKRAETQPQVIKTDTGEISVTKLVVNVDPKKMLSGSELTTQKLERLDGQLSLKNATIKIQF